jgi:hypothetical protein
MTYLLIGLYSTSLRFFEPISKKRAVDAEDQLNTLLEHHMDCVAAISAAKQDLEKVERGVIGLAT